MRGFHYFGILTRLKSYDDCLLKMRFISENFVYGANKIEVESAAAVKTVPCA